LFLFIILLFVFRGAILNEIKQTCEQYQRSYQNETKWVNLLKEQIDEYEKRQSTYKMQRNQLKQKHQTDDYKQQQQQQQQQTTTATTSKQQTQEVQSSIEEIDQDINELKQSFEPIAVNYFLCLYFYYFLNI
jgi:septal ring factor EnvC (AmiA/AmiB activator)